MMDLFSPHVGWAGFGWALALLSPLPAAELRPNLLFVLVDDQSPFDLRLYNPESELDTPVLDRLAAGGMVIEGAYHMGSYIGAVCNPSRHMIMSGRSLWHLPGSPDGTPGAPPDLPQQTIPALFNRGGYATMRTCKMGNSYEAANALFAVRRDATKRGGTDETGSPWHAQQVLSYLDEREGTGDTRPFLIYLGFSHPHDVREGRPELLAKYGATNHDDPATLPTEQAHAPRLPKAYLPAHPFRHGHDTVRDETAVSGVWAHRDPATIRNELGREYACAESIDRELGRVLACLEALGELENTWIFYTSDHGIALGRHGLMGKQNLYDHSWRVPFIAHGPGIPAGSRVTGNIYLMDLLATFCEIAGLPVPTSNHGLSFLPILTGQQTTLREVMYGAYNGGEQPGIRSVQQGAWKLIQYEAYQGKTRKIQLFNLATNPEELLVEHHHPDIIALTKHSPHTLQVNLAHDPAYAERLANMQSRLWAEMEYWQDPGRFWNQPTSDSTQR
jgi:choline-sulfatase